MMSREEFELVTGPKDYSVSSSTFGTRVLLVLFELFKVFHIYISVISRRLCYF